MNLTGFGSTLRGFRERRFLSVSELARKAGVAKSHISMLESGQRRPGLKVLGKLITVLELIPEEQALLCREAMETTRSQTHLHRPSEKEPPSWREMLDTLMFGNSSKAERAALGRILNHQGP